ncbi:MAG: hypothetical protein EOO09_13740 [Chitinophagaceae bacterium]|nr:MAG: hypothetical protein EOO09_13740 [Chitinophagaceae bacterium]
MFKPLLLCLTLATVLSARSQQAGISTGISFDVNNRFGARQVPLSLVLVSPFNTDLSLLVKADGALPVSGRRDAEAYTLQSGFNPSVRLNETIRTTWLGLSLGLRFGLKHFSGRNYLFADMIPLGLGSQSVKVKYEGYDNVNYEVLNPDNDLRRVGYFAGAGGGFVSGPFVAQVHIHTPLVAAKGDYKLNYKFVAPMSITIGYLMPGRTKK